MYSTALHNVAKIMLAKLSYKDMELGDLLREASLTVTSLTVTSLREASSASRKLKDLTTETNRCSQSMALGKSFMIYNQTREWVKWMFFLEEKMKKRSSWVSSLN